MSDDGPNDGTDGGSSDETDDGPSDETVVRTAAEAAERVVFSYYDQSTVRDLDVTVTFEDGVLDVDVYLHVPEGSNGSGPTAAAAVGEPADPDTVAREAADAAGDAVDDLFDA